MVDFMDPGKPGMIMVREDGVIELHQSPKIEHLDTPMDPLGDGGSQGHPAKKKVSKHMNFFDE